MDRCAKWKKCSCGEATEVNQVTENGVILRAYYCHLFWDNNDLPSDAECGALTGSEYLPLGPEEDGKNFFAAKVQPFDEMSNGVQWAFAAANDEWYLFFRHS